MGSANAWHVRGSYYEVCNCEAPCPCRHQGGRQGTGSQFQTCDFALSWMIHRGYFGLIDLQGLRVALAGYFDNNETAKEGGGRHPWHVILYVDERATPEQRSALADIFLGRAGGTSFENYARAIGEVYAIKPAKIELDHTPGKERLRVGESIWAATARAFPTSEPITCGIPGHDRPGMELVATLMRVEDEPFHWAFSGRCGFSTDFEFRSAA